MICKKLKFDVDCRIKWPSLEEQIELDRLIQEREPSLHVHAIGFIDGCSFPCGANATVDEQNAYYNGWKSGTFVNNVFVFSPTGKIIFASINAPGSWHDASITGDLFPMLLNERITLRNMGVIADTAFPRSGPLARKIHVGLRAEDISADGAVAATEIFRHAIITSLRQAAEWGMRALQGTFGRLKSSLQSDKKSRHDLILSILLLHNFRTEHVGFNQIATVFSSSSYQQGLHLNSYDRIARYYNAM